MSLKRPVKGRGTSTKLQVPAGARPAAFHWSELQRAVPSGRFRGPPHHPGASVRCESLLELLPPGRGARTGARRAAAAQLGRPVGSAVLVVPQPANPPPEAEASTQLYGFERSAGAARVPMTSSTTLALSAHAKVADSAASNTRLGGLLLRVRGRGAALRALPAAQAVAAAVHRLRVLVPSSTRELPPQRSWLSPRAGVKPRGVNACG